MAIGPASSVTAPAPAAAPGTGSTGVSEKASAASALSSDFETFLKMLTTQLQNQDPLNPIDSTDYAVQLATFAGVEQQVQTNDLLKSLGAGGAIGGLAQYAGWVGMEARTEGEVRVDGSPVELHYDLPEGARKAELVVKTTSGLELHRIDVTGAATPYRWAGTSPGGEPLLAGDYALSVETVGSTGAVETIPVSSYSEVTEVRSGGAGAEIVLKNGRSLAPEAIAALRGQ